MRGERRTGARAPLAVGAASLEINPSGRAGEGSDAAIAEREPVREGFGFGITPDGGTAGVWC